MSDQPHSAETAVGFTAPQELAYDPSRKKHSGWRVVENQGDSDPLQELLRATGQGDRQAFARVYQLAAPRLFAIALRVARRRDMAEDILQEAFLTIWDKASRYDPARGAPLAWMGTIVRYRAIDRLRRRDARETELGDHDVDAARANIDHTAETHQLGHDVRKALAQLAEKPRQALLLAYHASRRIQVEAPFLHPVRQGHPRVLVTRPNHQLQLGCRRLRGDMARPGLWHGEVVSETGALLYLRGAVRTMWG